MKILIIVILAFICSSFSLPLADTWGATAGNQILTGNSIRDGASTSGLYGTAVIPAGLNKKGMTKASIQLYTNITIGSALSAMPSNRCPTKDQIMSAY